MRQANLLGGGGREYKPCRKAKLQPTKQAFQGLRDELVALLLSLL